MSETIAAISTPLGISAISIIRISGARALEIAQKMTKNGEIRPRYAHLKYVLNDNGKIIDRAIVIYFKAPNSFNGEDIIEFQCHGGIAVAKSILDTCITLGARLAKPGEFSKRAIINGKMDIGSAENISKLIMTQSARGAEILAQNLAGELGEKIKNMRDLLLDSLSHIEAAIDYSEEDLPKDLKLGEKLDSIKTDLTRIYRHSQSIKNIIDGHKLIIIGKPNVGKSSILNRLLLKERAIVSEIEGTTRDLIEDSMIVASFVINIIDTAGIREGKEKIEKIGIEKTKEKIREASIILAVFDLSREFSDEDREICEILEKNGDKIVLCVLNKADKEIRFDKNKVKYLNPLEVSSLDDSVFKVRDLIESKITQTPFDNQTLAFINERQIECAKSAIDGISKAQENIGELEVCAFFINEVLRELENINMPFFSEEILDKMFSNFCLGK